MFEVDISPHPMMSVDLFLTEIQVQAGAAVFRVDSFAGAYAPTVIGSRNVSTQAIIAISSAAGAAPLVGGVASPIAIPPRATSTGSAPAPSTGGGGLVSAVVAAASGLSRPPTTDITSPHGNVAALTGSSVFDERIPMVTGETRVATVAGMNLESGVGARNGTTTHTVGHSSAATAPSSGCSVTFIPTQGRLLIVFIAGAVTHTSTGTGAGSGWTKQVEALSGQELSMFIKTAVGNDFITITHNASNYPMNWVMYELIAGSSYVTSTLLANTVTLNAFPTLSGLSTDPKLIIAAFSRGYLAANTVTGGSTPTHPFVEDSDSLTTGAGTENNYLYTFHADYWTDTSVTPEFTLETVGTMNSARQRIIGVFSVPSGLIRSSAMALVPAVSGT